MHDLKKLWEKIRLKRMPRAERREFVAKSLVLVHKSGGTVTDLIFKHDASRIVQSLVKYSESKTERPQLLAALATHYVELAQSPYGRFVVLKALKYAPDAAARSRIIAEFCAAPGKGGSSSSVTRLIRHKYADVIVDTIYCVYANAKERQAMVEHFYGAEYAILKQSASIVAKDGTSGAAGKKGTAGKNNVTLATVLAQFPDKKERIVQQLKERLIGMVSKEGTVGRNEILHRVLFELFSNQSLEEVVGLVAQPTAPFHMLLAQLPSVVHTKPGSQLAMIVLAAMGAKERKLLLKALKPHAKAMACNEFGWMVLARVFDW